MDPSLINKCMTLLNDPDNPISFRSIIDDTLLDIPGYENEYCDSQVGGDVRELCYECFYEFLCISEGKKYYNGGYFT